MDQSKIFSVMKNTESYPHPTQTIENIQTHISSVFLTGDTVYKIKKAVDFGFLDFSTLEKRKYYCEQELLLNRRLCPEIYLDVVPIVQKEDHSIQVNGSGSIIEYAVKMKQFPQDHIMSHLLLEKKVTKEHIDDIVDTLIAFYKNQEVTSEIASFGQKEAIVQNIMENFEQTESVIDITIDKERYYSIKQANEQFLQHADQIFSSRCNNGYITSCHGDLHSGNIVIDDHICIFDCIEFNKRFRYIDVASDIGFLAMDLDYQNEPFLSSYLIHEYIKRNGDDSIHSLLNFYKSYRAYVRGKVAGFQLSDPYITEKNKKMVIETASKYFSLSEYYIKLCSISQNISRPLLFLVFGLTGTGKSTISQKLSIDYNADVINTDVVRKQLAGIDQFEQHLDKPDTGLYAEDQQMKTYEKVLELAEMSLKSNKNIVLDATFQRKSHRDNVEALAKKYDSHLVRIQCVSPDEVVKQWLDERIKTKTVSDGRWEVYLHQKKTFESCTDDEDHIEIDVSKDSYDQRFHFFKNLQEKIEMLGE